MKSDAYILANKIKTEYILDDRIKSESLTEEEMNRYKMFLSEHTKWNEKDDISIDELKIPRRKAWQRWRSRWIAAAACMAVAVVLLSVVIFGENVYAAIEHISWSLKDALGISGDLADYKEIVDTSVSDSGYTVTLQEAIATDEKIVVNYTIQREDGQPMETIPSCDDTLYINGKRSDGASGGGGFLNDEQTVVGIATSYHLFDEDLTGENRYRLKIRNLDIENDVKGKWDFCFVADGSDLIADTRRIAIQKEFVIEDGVVITLEELSWNELEQRISYHTTKNTDFILKLIAEDSTGRKVQFDTQTYRGNEGIGDMINAEILYDGRISEDAKTVNMTLYAIKLPEENGRMNQDSIQIGESFELDLRN